MKIEHAYPRNPMDEIAARHGLDPSEEELISRHHKVAEIIHRHLEEIQQEILRLDPDTMNIDNAGDQAEIARQVLALLVGQLRGFGVGARDPRLT